jgi:hypothetical protein
LPAQLVEAEADVARIQAAHSVASGVLRLAKESLNQTTAAHEQARTSAANLRGQGQALEHLAAFAGSCRACSVKDPLDLTGRIEALQDQVDDAEEAEALAGAARSEARKAAAKAVDTVLEIQRAHVQAVSTRNNLLRDRDTAETTLKRAVAEEARASGALDRAAQDLAIYQAQEVPQGAAGDVDELRAQAGALESTRTTLEEERDRLVRISGAEAGLQKAIADRESAETKWRKAKSFLSALRELRGAVASAAYEPLTKEANGLLNKACIPVNVWMESESEWGGAIGKPTPEGLAVTKVHWFGLSDGERAVCAAALAYALVLLAKSPWRVVMLDRLEAIDTDRQAGLLRALAAEQRAGRIGNVIACLRADERGEVAELGDIDGVTVQWMGR